MFKLSVIVIIVFKRYPSTYCLMQGSRAILKFEHFTSKIESQPLNLLKLEYWNMEIRNNFFIFIFLAFDFLSVLLGHPFFSSPPKRPMTSDFEGFSIPDFIHYNYFPNLILEK